MEYSKARVLHVTHNMAFGGTEQVIRQIVTACDDQRYKSSIVCIDGKVGEIGQALLEEGVSVSAISRGSGLDRQAIAQLRSRIHSNNVNIVHCHQYTPFCYGAFASVGLKVQVIFTEHGRFHPDRYTWKRRIINQILYRLADNITSISDATRMALDKFEWIPKKRVSVIYNGVARLKHDECAQSIRDKLGIANEEWVLGTISRFDPIKNQVMMLQALQRIRTRFPNTVLLLAGDGPERSTLEKTARELAIEEAVYFTGFVSDIAEHLQAIDIFLLTSFSEGTSMTLLEAMSMGKAIIATAVGGNVEVIDDEFSGILVPSGDVDALVDRLIYLRNNPEYMEQLRTGAKQAYIDRFSVEKMVGQYEKLYQRTAVPQ